MLARALLSIALLPAIVHVGPAGAQVRYHLTKLASLGGTSSAGNSINHRGWIAGRSNLPDNQARHATFEAVPVGAHATTASPRIKRSDETAVRLTGSVEPHLHAQAAAD